VKRAVKEPAKASESEKRGREDKQRFNPVLGSVAAGRRGSSHHYGNLAWATARRKKRSTKHSI